MGVRQLLRFRDEVEVVVLIDKVLRNVLLRLEKPGRPVAVDELPVAIDVDAIPAVVDRLVREGHSWTVVHTLGPSTDREAGQARVTDEIEKTD